MRAVALEVCELQSSWSDRNTPEMQRRGELIRHAIPAWLASHRKQLAIALGPSGADLAFEGRDGTGRKTEVPWTRFYSESHSPNAREGWYCVYLFHARGDGFYLALGHGSTRWEFEEFKPRSREELHSLVSWARNALGGRLTAVQNLHLEIELGARKSQLGAAYADGTVAARWYPIGEIPADDQLARDASFFASLLGEIYRAQDLGRDPESGNPDVRASAVAIEAIARPLTARNGRGQGFGLSVAERRVVEEHAMLLARRYLEGMGWMVTDVSATKSFDFEARRSTGETLIVEVKGTTAGPEEVLLTANEVAIQRNAHPNNALVVVHGINLTRGKNGPAASGGVLVKLTPWQIALADLTPTAFRYRLPPQ